MNRYFGPASGRKEWEQQVDTPVGTRCMYCTEEVVQGDMGTMDNTGVVLHHECQFRMVVGSLAHQQGRCSCFGGTDAELPEGMTPREEARAAVQLYETAERALAAAMQAARGQSGA